MPIRLDKNIQEIVGAANNVKLLLIEFARLAVYHENNSKKMGEKEIILRMGKNEVTES